MYRTVLAVLMVLRCSLLFGQSSAGSSVSKGDELRAEAEIRQILRDLAAGQRSKPYANESGSTLMSSQRQMLRVRCSTSLQ
jgi:hypothetical protein